MSRLCICLETNCFPVQFSLTTFEKRALIVWCHKIKINDFQERSCAVLHNKNWSVLCLFKEKRKHLFKKKVQIFHHDKEKEIKVELAWEHEENITRANGEGKGEEEGTKAQQVFDLFSFRSLSLIFHVEFICTLHCLKFDYEMKTFLPYTLFPERRVFIYTHSLTCTEQSISFFKNKKVSRFVFICLS